MALYFIVNDVGSAIVRARNGHRAQELVGGGAVIRLDESGPEEVIVGAATESRRKERPPQRFLGDAAD